MGSAPDSHCTKEREMKRTAISAAATLRASTAVSGSASATLTRMAPVLSSGSSKREVHEINVPDWGHYKREAQEGGESGGRAFSYMVLGTAGVGYAAAAKHTVIKFLDSMNPAANVRAMANVEVDVSKIADAESAPLTDMRDPCPDAARRKADKPEWLIVLGVCTHLGCVPLGGQGEYGGWFCPCHGSHYDTAGRIRKGPAPLNLEVPPYVFKDDSKVLVGVDS